MNPDIKTKWVAALRSGQYKQIGGELCNETGFCCLGVLCEISKLETGFGIPDNLDETHGDDHLGKTVMEWSGLIHSCGDTVVIRGTNLLLASHNDGGRTFKEIATAIEAQL